MAALIQKILNTDTSDRRVDIALLILRVAVGVMMMTGHGWGKLVSYGERAATFGDPLGIGSQLSMTLAVFAEFFCSLFLVFGFVTRLSSIPLLITMLVAGLIVHADDPWRRKEMAFLYASTYLTLFFTGGGKYSIDRLLGRRFRGSDSVDA